ncbi:MAG: hypothetical protein LBE57_04745 [Methanosarcinales archaeon]|jgi:hypothetical protein|nr:hypothetical protein [Methanosarcinales archaeon]
MVDPCLGVKRTVFGCRGCRQMTGVEKRMLRVTKFDFEQTNYVAGCNSDNLGNNSVNGYRPIIIIEDGLVFLSKKRTTDSLSGGMLVEGDRIVLSDDDILTGLQSICDDLNKFNIYIGDKQILGEKRPGDEK